MEEEREIPFYSSFDIYYNIYISWSLLFIYSFFPSTVFLYLCSLQPSSYYTDGFT